MNTGASLFVYIVGAIVGLILTYILVRWIFAIDKQVSQNQTIINLLIEIAKKQGVSEDEILLTYKTQEEVDAIKRKKKKQ